MPALSRHRPDRPTRALARLLLLSAVLIALAGPLGPAAAATAAPGVAVDPGYGPPLATVKVIGSGFCPPPCGPVAINFAGIYVTADVAVDSNGAFSTIVQVPGSARPGQVAVVASQRGGPVARTSFTVTINAPAPTQYPRPTSLPLPGGVPSLQRVPVQGPATGSDAPTRPAVAGPRTSVTSDSPQSTRSPSPGALLSTSARAAPRDHAGLTGSGWLLLLLAVVALPLAGGFFWLSRRARRP